MSIDEARRIIHTEMDGIIPIDGYELTNYYIFTSVADSNGNVCFDSSTYIVNKRTRECGKFGGFDTIDSWEKYIDYGEEEFVRRIE